MTLLLRRGCPRKTHAALIHLLPRIHQLDLPKMGWTCVQATRITPKAQFSDLFKGSVDAAKVQRAFYPQLRKRFPSVTAAGDVVAVNAAKPKSWEEAAIRFA